MQHNIETDAHCALLGMFVGVNMGFSLREKYRERSETDFPLPLAVVDTEKERLIFEKDEEVCFSYSPTHSFTHTLSHSGDHHSFMHLFLSVAEEDAGSAGEDSRANAAQSERWLLILP